MEAGNEQNSPTPPETILLVEDEPLIAMVVSDSLSSWGFEIAEAGSIAEARVCIAQASRPFRLAIVDVGLPDGRGDLFAGELAAAQAGICIILTSGYEPDSLEMPPEHRARFGVLAKPYDSSRLRYLIAQLTKGTAAL